MAVNLTPYVKVESDGNTFTLTEAGEERVGEFISQLHEVAAQAEDLTFLDLLIFVDQYKGVIQQIVEKQFEDLSKLSEDAAQQAAE